MQGIEVINSQPGQLSLAISRMKDNQLLARQVEESFSVIQGISRVEADAILGTVMIAYDKQELTTLRSLLHLKDTFALCFPEINPMTLAAYLGQHL